MAAEETVLFSVRIPVHLLHQITQRATINRRSRNSEIIRMLERTIDSGVESTLALIKAST